MTAAANEDTVNRRGSMRRCAAAHWISESVRLRGDSGSVDATSVVADMVAIEWELPCKNINHYFI